MELTAEQIQRVNNYLDARNLNYVDVRMEVFDHMVCTIEDKVNTNVDFDTALITTIQQWDNELKPVSTWFIGHLYLRPKIIINKAKKHTLLYLFTFLSVFIIPISKYLTFSVDKNIYQYFFLMSILLIITVILMYYVMLRSKIKTTYLFLFEKSSFYGSLFSFLLISVGYNSNSFLYTTFTFLLICYTLFGFYFFMKHQKTVLLWN